LGEEGSAKEETFRTAFCIPLFFNPFDPVDMGMTMEYRLLQMEVLQKNHARGISNFPKENLAIRNKKIEKNNLSH
jgi:hypothetical protein